MRHILWNTSNIIAVKFFSFFFFFFFWRGWWEADFVMCQGSRKKEVILKTKTSSGEKTLLYPTFIVSLIRQVCLSKTHYKRTLLTSQATHNCENSNKSVCQASRWNFNGRAQWHGCYLESSAFFTLKNMEKTIDQGRSPNHLGYKPVCACVRRFRIICISDVWISHHAVDIHHCSSMTEVNYGLVRHFFPLLCVFRVIL